ncbi:hypothetical protein Ddye_015585 [Dipteronia dyeriana]|uniref:Uncharacterized protein n=1 Tax=Dipteronia dyeriana TaxID=168575 RepID=A0AAD9U5V9_9ROSI|nr:hypothetical protein Ddye_015585 [Dipteronia dyeriana]
MGAESRSYYTSTIYVCISVTVSNDTAIQSRAHQVVIASDSRSSDRLRRSYSIEEGSMYYTSLAYHDMYDKSNRIKIRGTDQRLNITEVSLGSWLIKQCC